MALSKADFFIVKDRKTAELLRRIVARKRRGYEVNTYSGPKLDKTGKTIFTLGYDDKPDSDWGRYSGHKLIVRLRESNLATYAEDAIRSGLGWQCAPETSPSTIAGEI